MNFKDIKTQAKRYFKYNYWFMVIAALAANVASTGSIGLVNPFASISTSSGDQTSISSYVSGLSSYEIAALIRAMILAVIIVFVFYFVMAVLALAPLLVGSKRFFLVSHYRKAEIDELTYAFSHNYLNIVKTMFLRDLIVFLWSLLFIIPGIIKAYEYAMVPFILAEHPDIDARTAREVSREMMDGHKWEYFLFALSFIGWSILGVCTFGILNIFWTNPYMQMSCAEYFVRLKELKYGKNA